MRGRDSACTLKGGFFPVKADVGLVQQHSGCSHFVAQSFCVLQKKKKKSDRRVSRGGGGRAQSLLVFSCTGHRGH